VEFGIGVLGATGFIGTPYRQEIREAGDAVKIVALCARRRDRLEAAAKEDGAVLATDDWRQVVEHPDVNLVVVATPDALHYEAVMACAELGKHVVCEIPVGLNVGEAYSMWLAIRDAGLGHFVPFWNRNVEVFRRAREIVAEGTLGEIKAVIYRWHNARPAAIPFTWRDDADVSASGTIGDVGSHAYDLVRWMLSREGTEFEARRVLVHADVISSAKPDLGAIDLSEALDWSGRHARQDSAKQRQGSAYDYASIAWEFHNGAVGMLLISHAPVLRKGLAPELELHGSEASLAVHRSGKLMLAQADAEAELLETVPDSGFGNRFAKYVFPAIRQRAAGQPCEHPGLDDGWRVQIFTDASALSAQRGGWVELAELDAQLRSG